MFNLKKAKTMKRILLGVLALAGLFAVSCNKEIEMPGEEPVNPAATHTVTIRASFGEETRTAYANDKTFSWVKSDTILVYVANEETNKAYLAEFLAQDSGATAEFVGEVEDGFVPAGIAFYTAAGSYATWDQENFYVNLPGTTAIDDDSFYYHVDSSNPMSNVPLMGYEVESGVFQFRTLTGVLKFNLTGLDPAARYFELSATGTNKLQGHFALDLENGTLNLDGGREGTFTYKDSDGTEQTARYSYSNLYYHFLPDADGNATIYVPVPVGKLNAGATLSILDAEGSLLFEKKTEKDIQVTRNKLLEIASLKADFNWVSLGTGKFTDAYIFYDFGATEDLVYVDVEIQKNSDVPGAYRLVRPYEAAVKALTGSVPADFSAGAYFNFRTLQVGESVYGTPVTVADQIIYDEYVTGMIEPDSQTPYSLTHPSMWTKFGTENSWGRNEIVKYQKNGTPAIVMVGPIYLWGDYGFWTGNSSYHLSSKNFQIFFPGVSVQAIDWDSSVSYTELLDDSPEQAIASVKLAMGPDVNYAELVIAQDEAAALAALASSTGVTDALSSGNYEVAFPANASSGEYKVYAYIHPDEDVYTAASNLLIASQTFRYFNSNDDLGFTVADLVGDYISEPLYCYYYREESGGFEWGISDADVIYIHIEESDDDFSGNVMITAMGTLWGSGSMAPNSDNVFNIYGTFNTRSGQAFFESGAPFYDLDYQNTAIAPCSDFSGETPFEFILDMDKETLTYTTGQIYYMAYNMVSGQITGYYQVTGGYPDTPVTLYKFELEDEAPMAVKAAGRNSFKRNYWMHTAAPRLGGYVALDRK